MRKFLTTITICGAIILCATALNSCASKKDVSGSKTDATAPKTPFVPLNPEESVVIKRQDTLIMLAGFVGEAAYVSNDTLYLRAQYNGGCGLSEFYLMKTDSTPTKAAFKLFRSTNDWCKDPQTKDYFFILKNINGREIEVFARDRKLL